MSRREKIEAMLASEPNDAFLRYSLAMELGKEENTDQALELYTGLMNDDPPYVPSFLMAAQLCVRLEDISRARTILREGIEVARGQGDAHAAGEMADLLANLGQLGEA